MTVLYSRSALLRLPLACMVALILALPAVSQEGDVTCVGANLSTYAELGFCLPEEVVVEPEAVEEAKYSGGREVRASMLLNGSRTSLHILYPCLPPESELDPAAMRSLLEAYDPAMGQANYSENLIEISGRPAVWGQVGERIFAAYQPAVQNPVLVVLDGNMSSEIMVEFLGNLSITPTGDSPLLPGDCPDITAAPAEVTGEGVTSQAGQVTPTSNAELRQTSLEASKQRMAADMEAAKKRLEETKERMFGYRR